MLYKKEKKGKKRDSYIIRTRTHTPTMPIRNTLLFHAKGILLSKNSD
eukprot:UN02359